MANEVTYMENVDRIPFRADHVGSLLRPEPLHEARRQFAAGTLEAAALRELEDREISRVVARQESVGLRSATDGEFRRASWISDFVQNVTGVPSRTSMPIALMTRSAACEHGSENAGSTRGPASARMMRAELGSMSRKSRVMELRASSAIAPGEL